MYRAGSSVQEVRLRYHVLMLVPLILAAASLPVSVLQPAGNASQPAAAEVREAEQPLRWNWQKGTATRYTVTQSLETSAEGLLEYSLSQTQKQRILVEVEDVSPAGDASLKLTLESIEVTTITAKGAQPVVVSSQAKPTNEEFDPSGACRALVGLTLTVVTGPDGTLREIRGIPALKERVKAVLAEPPTLANLAADVLVSFEEIQLRSRIEPALVLEPKEPRTKPAPINFRGLGTLLADQAIATSSNAGIVTVHRTTDFSLLTPNTDDITTQFDVSLTEGREEGESTLDPRAGIIRKVASTLKLTTVLTPKKPSAEMKKTTRTLAQTILIEPVSESGAASPVTPPPTPPAALGKP